MRGWRGGDLGAKRLRFASLCLQSLLCVTCIAFVCALVLESHWVRHFLVAQQLRVLQLPAEWATTSAAVERPLPQRTNAHHHAVKTMAEYEELAARGGPISFKYNILWGGLIYSMGGKLCFTYL
jgi:hypothetical protein